MILVTPLLYYSTFI